MGRSEVRPLEDVLDCTEQWLGELVEVRERLRAIEGVHEVNRVRAVLEERREAIEKNLRACDESLGRCAAEAALRVSIDEVATWPTK